MYFELLTGSLFFCESKNEMISNNLIGRHCNQKGSLLIPNACHFLWHRWCGPVARAVEGRWRSNAPYILWKKDNVPKTNKETKNTNNKRLYNTLRRNLSNFNFQWTKTLYLNNLNNIPFFFTFFKALYL